VIACQNVAKSFDGGHAHAVRDVSLTVEEGETLVLLGSSGSGKTTLLRLVNRLLEPTAGRVLVAGADVSREDPVQLRRRIGYVFQGIGLFPHLTAAANIELVPRLLGWSDARRAERVAELLNLVGLDPEAHGARYPDELSGGQQQRIGVARALAADPAILLMDEPFGALDALTRDALQQELRTLKQRLRKTILFVTHDILEAFILGDRIGVMHAGRLEQIGTREEILRRPATEFVRDLLARPARQLAALDLPDAG
jgi:osmoprotectant transport system ATP-binding protein